MGIHPVQDAAVARDQVGEILDTVMTLDQREDQVTDLGDQRQKQRCDDEQDRTHAEESEQERPRKRDGTAEEPAADRTFDGLLG